MYNFVHETTVALTYRFWQFIEVACLLLVAFLFISFIRKRIVRTDPLGLKYPTYSCFRQDGQFMLIIESTLKNYSDLPQLIAEITVMDRDKKEYPTQKYASTAVWVQRSDPKRNSTTEIPIDTTMLPFILKPKESTRIILVISLGKEVPTSLRLPVADNLASFNAIDSNSDYTSKFPDELNWQAELLIYTSTGPFYVYPTIKYQHKNGYYQMGDGTLFYPDRSTT